MSAIVTVAMNRDDHFFTDLKFCRRIEFGLDFGSSTVPSMNFDKGLAIGSSFQSKTTAVLRGFGTENTDGLDRRGDKPLPVSNKFHPETGVNSAHLTEAPAQGRSGQPALCQIRYVFAAFDKNLAAAPVNYGDFVQAINGADVNSLHLLEFVNLRPVPPRIPGPHIQSGPTGQSFDVDRLRRIFLMIINNMARRTFDARGLPFSWMGRIFHLDSLTVILFFKKADHLGMPFCPALFHRNPHLALRGTFPQRVRASSATALPIVKSLKFLGSKPSS
jgi:hypothetical protein